MILNVQPKTQLLPFPMIMGCESTVASMLLEYNGINYSPRKLAELMPKHTDDPRIGYVGHPSFLYFNVHQTIFPKPLGQFLKSFDDKIVVRSKMTMKELEDVLDTKQPIIMLPTNNFKRPKYKTFQLSTGSFRTVSNIHAILLIGYDEQHYFYIDPILFQFKFLHLPALWPSKRQIFKIRKSKFYKGYVNGENDVVYREVSLHE